MKSVGAATAACERITTPHSWGGFGNSSPLQMNTAVRLSVQFLHSQRPTAQLAVWAYLVPTGAMQHAISLGRNSWMQFGKRT